MAKYDPDPEVVALALEMDQRRIPLARLCARAKINPSTFWRWTQGRARPVNANLRALRRALDEEVAEQLAA